MAVLPESGGIRVLGPTPHDIAPEPNTTPLRFGTSAAPGQLVVLTAGTRSDGCNLDIHIDDADSVQLRAPIAAGTNAALSPDGHQLAFVTQQPQEEGRPCSDDALVVLDLDSGVRKVWSAYFPSTLGTETYNGGAIVSTLNWSPDSGRLVFATYEGNLISLDASQPSTSIRDGRLLQSGKGNHLSPSPVWNYRSGELLVLERGSQIDGEQNLLIVMNPETGGQRGTPLSHVEGSIVGIAEDGFSPLIERRDGAEYQLVEEVNGREHPIATGQFRALTIIR